MTGTVRMLKDSLILSKYNMRLPSGVTNSYVFVHCISYMGLYIFNLSLHYRFGDRKR